MGHFEHGHFYTYVDKKGALFSFTTYPPCQPAGYSARGYLLQDLLLPLPALHRPHVAEAPGEARVDLGRPVEVRRPRELPGGRYESDYPRPAATRSSSRIARQDLAKRSGPIAGGRKIQPGSGKPCGPASPTPFIATRTARGQATRRIRNRLASLFLIPACRLSFSARRRARPRLRGGSWNFPARGTCPRRSAEKCIVDPKLFGPGIRGRKDTEPPGNTTRPLADPKPCVHATFATRPLPSPLHTFEA